MVELFIQKKTEMADCGEGSQEFKVEGGEAGLGVGQLLGEEPQGGPRTVPGVPHQRVYLRHQLLGR